MGEMRRKRLSRGHNRTAKFGPDPADPVVVRTARPRYTYLTEARRFSRSTRNVL